MMPPLIPGTSTKASCQLGLGSGGQHANPGRQRNNYQSRHDTKSKSTPTTDASEEHLADRVSRKPRQNWENGISGPIADITE